MVLLIDPQGSRKTPPRPLRGFSRRREGQRCIWWMTTKKSTGAARWPFDAGMLWAVYSLGAIPISLNRWLVHYFTFRRVASGDGNSQFAKARAHNAPRNSAAMKPGASSGLIPEKVLVKARAIVTAGLAKDVDAVNQ